MSEYSLWTRLSMSSSRSVLVATLAAFLALTHAGFLKEIVVAHLEQVAPQSVEAVTHHGVGPEVFRGEGAGHCAGEVGEAQSYNGPALCVFCAVPFGGHQPGGWTEYLRKNS